MAAAHRVAHLDVIVDDIDAWQKLVYELGAESGTWNPKLGRGLAHFRTAAEAEAARREV